MSHEWCSVWSSPSKPAPCHRSSLQANGDHPLPTQRPGGWGSAWDGGKRQRKGAGAGCAACSSPVPRPRRCQRLLAVRLCWVQVHSPAHHILGASCSLQGWWGAGGALDTVLSQDCHQRSRAGPAWWERPTGRGSVLPGWIIPAAWSSQGRVVGIGAALPSQPCSSCPDQSSDGVGGAPQAAGSGEGCPHPQGHAEPFSYLGSRVAAGTGLSAPWPSSGPGKGHRWGLPSVSCASVGAL